jgi:lipopolysaccharide biosynthesis regulator YciM
MIPQNPTDCMRAGLCGIKSVIASHPETYPALQASRKLISIHRRQKAWEKAAEECRRRLCLWAQHNAHSGICWPVIRIVSFGT